METVRAALATIRDPEMPISIVDLGIVHDVRIQSGNGIAYGASYVSVDITPTFVGCPALGVLREQIHAKLAEIPEVLDVEVNFTYAPPWSSDRITLAGREALARHGISTPSGQAAASKLVQLGGATAAQIDEAVACPLCGSAQTQLESRFGPTRCRMIYYCNACKNSFERMKRI